MSNAQVVDFIEAMVDAALIGDGPRLTGLLNGLLRGPRGDAYVVAATLAAAVGESVVLPPGETFHRVKVKVIHADGSVTEGSADQLPPAVRLFVRMVVAINNGDRELARDLFVGTVGEHSRRAYELILYGLTLLIRMGSAEVGHGR